MKNGLAAASGHGLRLFDGDAFTGAAKRQPCQLQVRCGRHHRAAGLTAHRYRERGDRLFIRCKSENTFLARVERCLPRVGEAAVRAEWTAQDAGNRIGVPLSTRANLELRREVAAAQ